MTQPSYKYFDGDTHFYETRDVFTRYLDPKFSDRAVHSRTDPDTGRERVWIGDEPFAFLPGWSYEQVAPPGALREMLRALSSGKINDERPIVNMAEPYVSRSARLAVMDEQSVESVIALPTLAITVETPLKHDPPALYANHHAFNQWLDEEWGFAYQDRIFSPPLISLLDLDEAVKELDWVLDRGAKIVHLRAGPAYGRSPADPYFDPFWSRLNDAGAVLAFHIAESGYSEMMGPYWGENPRPSSHKQSAFQWINLFGDRPLMDTISALIVHNLFGRFPNIRVMSIENGSLWVPYLLKAMDKMIGMGRNGPWIGGRLEARPSEIFKQHVFVSPYHEEDVEALVGLIGASQVVFGSDWPHPEGLATPSDYLDSLKDLNEVETRMIMRDNARTLLNLPVAADA